MGHPGLLAPIRMLSAAEIARLASSVDFSEALSGFNPVDGLAFDAAAAWAERSALLPIPTFSFLATLRRPPAPGESRHLFPLSQWESSAREVELLTQGASAPGGLVLFFQETGTSEPASWIPWGVTAGAAMLTRARSIPEPWLIALNRSGIDRAYCELERSLLAPSQDVASGVGPVRI